MKRIGILTAGGDTPALNATIYGAVQRANALKIEVVGLLRGYAGLLDPQVPHVLLNPLYSSIPELDPCKGGTLIGSSRTYLDHNSHEHLQVAGRHAAKLQLDGLICIGGDGTINGMQPLAEMLPCVLAPKTIDNDLGLNYPGEPDEWQRPQGADGPPVRGVRSRDTLRLEDIINYATPGFATAVFVVVQMVERLRTTAESHHRIAVVEVMGRQSGYIALGAAYAQPDIILIPEVPVDPHQLTQQVSRIYEQQQNVVIVVGEGVRGVDGRELGAAEPAFDPAGNVKYAGAADAIVGMLEQSLSPDLFLETRRFEPGSSALFSRKVGHTQRGGRPILFDRFAATQLGARRWSCWRRDTAMRLRRCSTARRMVSHSVPLRPTGCVTAGVKFIRERCIPVCTMPGGCSCRRWAWNISSRSSREPWVRTMWSTFGGKFLMRAV